MVQMHKPKNTTTITFITMLVPIGMVVAQTLGIPVSEEAMYAFVAMFLGSGAIGTRHAIAKKRQDNGHQAAKGMTVDEGKVHVHEGEVYINEVGTLKKMSLADVKKIDVADIEKSISKKKSNIQFVEPEWTTERGWYSTNLKNNDNDDGGVKRYLPQGMNCLWIKIAGAAALTTQLFNPDGNLVQIDQSHAKDEDDDVETTRIELFDTLGQRYPPGIYSVRIQAQKIGGQTTSIQSTRNEYDDRLPFIIL